MTISHPLANGTKVVADLNCPSCHIGSKIEENLQETTIRNHINRDGIITYRVTGANFEVYAGSIKQVLE